MPDNFKFNETSGLPMLHDGTTWRTLGTLPPHSRVALPKFGDAFDVLPESQWVETNFQSFNVPILNQGQHGSCTGHAAVDAFTYAWLMSGQPYVALSPTSVYAHINGGVDQGATVSDSLICLKTYGACLMSQFGEDQLYMSELSAEAQQTALRFRVEEAYQLTDWQSLCTALSRGLPCVSGLAVGYNFSNLDSNGIAPLPNAIAGGHALCHVGLKNINGQWVIYTQNSWNGWGINGTGFCYLQEGAYSPNYGFGFDCYAISGVLTDPQETNPPVLTN